jgi:hypothetical protein
MVRQVGGAPGVMKPQVGDQAVKIATLVEGLPHNPTVLAPPRGDGAIAGPDGRRDDGRAGVPRPRAGSTASQMDEPIDRLNHDMLAAADDRRLLEWGSACTWCRGSSSGSATTWWTSASTLLKMPGPVRTVAIVIAADVADWQGARFGPGWARVSGQHPGTILVGKAKHQQAAQVDSGDAHRPPQVVAFDPAVGHPPAAVGDQPGDRAFHHRPPAPVALLEAAGGRAAPRGAQLVLVGVDLDGAATLGAGAAPS